MPDPADGDGLADTELLGEVEADGLELIELDGLCDGELLGDALELADELGLTEAEADCEAELLGETEADGL